MAFPTNVTHVGSESSVGIEVITKISLFFKTPAAIVAHELGKDRRWRDRRTFEKIGAEIRDGVEWRLALIHWLVKLENAIFVNGRQKWSIDDQFAAI